MMQDRADHAVFSVFSEPPKQSMTMWWVAGGLVIAIVSLAAFGLSVVGGESKPEAVKVEKAVAPAAVQAAPVAAPVELKEVDPAQAPAAAPEVVPAAGKAESTKLSPAKPRSEEMVDMGANDDELAPLAKAKAARGAAPPAVKVNHAHVVKSAFPVMSNHTAAEVAAHLSPTVVAPVQAPAAVAAPATPDEVFEAPAPVAAAKETSVDSKRPTP
jgi:hypothetical protein